MASQRAMRRHRCSAADDPHLSPVDPALHAPQERPRDRAPHRRNQKGEAEGVGDEARRHHQGRGEQQAHPVDGRADRDLAPGRGGPVLLEGVEALPADQRRAERRGQDGQEDDHEPVGRLADLDDDGDLGDRQDDQKAEEKVEHEGLFRTSGAADRNLGLTYDVRNR